MSFNSVAVYVARIKRALHRVVWEPLRRRATFWVALVSRRDYGRRIHVLMCTHISTHGWCTSTLRTYTYVGRELRFTHVARTLRAIYRAHIPARYHYATGSTTRRYSPWSRDGDPRVHRYSGTRKPSQGIYLFGSNTIAERDGSYYLLLFWHRLLFHLAFRLTEISVKTNSICLSICLIYSLIIESVINMPVN